MGLIFKIAFRNILRHKGKSIVIGIILFIGALLMTIGNGVISGMNRGLEDNIVNGFMGDVVLISDKQESDNILLDMTGRSAETINNYKSIKKILLEQSYIEKFLPAGKNLAMAISEEFGSGVYLIGVDFKEYQKMFPDNIKAIEGRLMKQREVGVLVPAFTRKEYYDYTGIWLIAENSKIVEKNLSDDAKENIKNLKTENNVVYLGFNEGNTTKDIRLGVKGIIKYKAINQIFGHFNIVDVESYRECLGYFSASNISVVVPSEKKNLLKMENQNLDSLFEQDKMFVEDTGEVNINELKTFKPLKKEKNVDIEAGVYNLIFVKLKKGISYENILPKLNKVLLDNKTGVRATSWKKASGIIGSMATLIKTVLFLFVMFLFFVAIIIIVNTLSMSAIERTSEIGMMRAIGARKGFIRSMFLGETSMLSFVFGGAGIIAGIIIVEIIPLLNMTTENDVLQILYGGEKFSPVLFASDILLTITQLILVTFLAVIYPIKVAKSITPLDAITRD